MIERREVLKAIGATVAISTAAGCSGDDGDGGDLPAYERWLTTDDSDELVFGYVDRSVLDHFDDGDEGEAESGDESSEDADPLLGIPLGGASQILVFAAFGTMGTGLQGILTRDEDAEGRTEADFETTIDEILLANDALVLRGDVDTDEVDAELREPPEPDSPFVQGQAYERTDEIDEFDLYEPTDGDGSAIAVDDDAIVAVFDSDGDAAEAVRAPIEARAGDRDRAADEIEDVEWLLETAGRGDLVFGGGGASVRESDGANESAYPGLDGATGIVASLEIDGDTEVSGDFAGAFAGAVDEEQRSDLEAGLGVDADDVDVSVEDDRVTASATWQEDVNDVLRTSDQ